MKALGAVLAILSSLVLGAHLLRAGWAAAAVAVALSPLLLLLGRPFAVRLLQALLGLGALEWLRTLVSLASLRLAAGAPYLRLVAILATVALVTAATAALLERHLPRRAA